MSCVFREQENAKILLDEGSISADTPETVGILRAGGAHGQYRYRERNDFAIRFLYTYWPEAAEAAPDQTNGSQTSGNRA